MELKDKIIILRKQMALSQEGLAEKLNVTRQTISNWELGESKPNVDMLNEMSKIFHVNVEVLMNDELSLDDKNNKKEKDKKVKNRKYILYILIVILIISIIILVIRIGNDKKSKENKFWNFVNSIFDRTEEFEREMSPESFNIFLKNETTSGFFLLTKIDTIIDSNKSNQDHLIEVVFDGTNYGKDTNNIGEIKSKINDSADSKYEISLDYDKDGYINKVTITTKETISPTSFNQLFEFYSGTQYNSSVRSLLDDVIKSNKKYKEHLVEVVCRDTLYGTDEAGIRNAKASIGTNAFKENEYGFIEYEVSLDYDEKGYVIKITIEEL